MKFKLPEPKSQIEFAEALLRLRGSILQNSLLEVVGSVPVQTIDKELVEFADPAGLSLLAQMGIRGELMYAVPCLLEKRPTLLGYYRLLLGISQKSFYSSETHATRCKVMEESGIIPKSMTDHLGNLCSALNQCASSLLMGLPKNSISAHFLDDLSLLTLGPQLRGGANVRKGTDGINIVFEAIRKLVANQLISETSRCLKIRNSAGRIVLIELSPDPDIVIKEIFSKDSTDFRRVIAIEVKAGTDFSNIHNRIGEAEKSHQKAKNEGYTECWTIINVDRADTDFGKKESPSTNRFFLLSNIVAESGVGFEDFKSRISTLTGIPILKSKKSIK